MKIHPPAIVCAVMMLGSMVLGCGEDFTGHWCGRSVDDDAACAGDEVGFLLLHHEDESIGGQACEFYEHDCHIIERGKVDGANVTFHYSFKDGEVDATLTLDGDELRGTFRASKCKCDVTQVYYRVP